MPQYAAATKPAQHGQRQTLAVLFIIIDKLPFEEIWRSWADAGAGEAGWTARFWVHAKYPAQVKSEWVRQRLLPVSFVPEWGSVELVRAATALMDAALEDSTVQRLVLASESCVPVCRFAQVRARCWHRDVCCRSTSDGGTAGCASTGERPQVVDACLLVAWSRGCQQVRHREEW